MNGALVSRAYFAKLLSFNLPIKFNQFNVAVCFSFFILPHVFFVENFETQKKAAMRCCLAWNISLFPEAEQVDYIAQIWKLVEADNQDALPPGLGQGFKQDRAC